MFQEQLEKMQQFAAEGRLLEELAIAREEFIERTGAMFESDEGYEQRLAVFLEWYALDRPVSFAAHMTPAKMYIEEVAPKLTTPELTTLRELTRTTLSLFEFKKAKKQSVRLVNLLTNTKHDVFERRRPAGLQSGDIIEARLVPQAEASMMSDVVIMHPRVARKSILKAAKRFRKNGTDQSPIDIVHRVAYLSNRCERYSHVDPLEIFAELN